MHPDEQVLVIERKAIEPLGIFNGLVFNTKPYLDRIFTPGVPRFMPRAQAEKDPNFKQLIPYVIIAHDGKYLSYVRGKRAGETRLVGNRSIGIGGHINPVDHDAPLFNTNFYDTYLAAVEREIAEEITINSPHTNNIVALLNDESNEVGSVHLGLVHFCKLQSPNVTRKEQMITQMTFMSEPELQKEKPTLETWSALCLDGIQKLQSH